MIILSDSIGSSLLKSKFQIREPTNSILGMKIQDAKLYMDYLIKQAVYNLFLNKKNLCLYTTIIASISSMPLIDNEDYYETNYYKKILKFNKFFENGDRFVLYEFLFSHKRIICYQCETI